MSKPILSPTELEFISKVSQFIYELNNPGGEPSPEFPGYFTWEYRRDGDVVAEPSADFPSEVELSAPSDN